MASSSSEVIVPSVRTMVNLLGLSPEPGFSITPAHHEQFFMLEVCIAVHVYTCTVIIGVSNQVM